MPKTLILVTNHFPFDSAEAFIETEYPFLSKRFSKVYILCRNVVSKEIRDGIYNYYRVDPKSDWKEYLFLPIFAFRHFRKVTKLVKDEIAFLKSANKFNTPNFRTLLHDLGKALITSHYILDILKKQKVDGKVVLYSYWLNSSALATILVNSKSCDIKRISRAHGGDVYEERHTNNYLPFRNSLAKYLNVIFCISEDSVGYLKTKIKSEFYSTLKLGRLGTSNNGQANPKLNSIKTILSCSFLLPVKRVDFFIEALAHLQEVVEWIHIGDGPLANQLQEHAKSKLSNKINIKYSFKGTLTSGEIQDFYRHNSIYLFINTSSSEGIPVTMMEAQSYGIPILALNVGGVKELVNSKNGMLLQANSSTSDFAMALNQMLQLPLEEYNTMRKEARQNWDIHYNAEKNFSTFADQISNLN